MNDLPIPTVNVPSNSSLSSLTPASGGIHKEAERMPVGQSETQILKEAREVSTELPKEVISAGVTIHPTSIPIPQSLAQMGVAPVGTNVPMPAPVVLPLTDDQIAKGLGMSIANSWRWLAVWCVRRMKQVHIGLKAVHGTLVHVRI